MKIHLFSLAYGEEHIGYFRRVSFRSLMQAGNLPALVAAGHEVQINLYSDETGNQLAAELDALEGIGCQIHPVFLSLKEKEEGQTYDVLFTSLNHAVSACVVEDAALLFCPPDTFFGNGSLGHAASCVPQPGDCLAVPHLRVETKPFLALLDTQPADAPVSNPVLARISMESLHDVWRRSTLGAADPISFAAGISLAPVAPDLFIVEHRLPTVYLARPRAGDLAFFQANRWARGTLWDHEWPGKLVAERRLRVAGSSDIFCAAELTAPETMPSDTPPAGAGGPFGEYMRYGLHNEMGRSFFYALRTDRPPAK